MFRCFLRYFLRLCKGSFRISTLELQGSILLCRKVSQGRKTELLVRSKSYNLSGSIWWCGRVVKVQYFEPFKVYSRQFDSPLSEPLTTSKQSTQLPILRRSVYEYSEVILRVQAVMPQAHISCIDATYPARVNK